MANDNNNGVSQTPNISNSTVQTEERSPMAGGLISLSETDLNIQRSALSTDYAGSQPDHNRAFSGADLIAFLVPKAEGSVSAPYVPVKNLGAISYSVHRDKVPVRSLGTPRAKSYTLGTRTIAGSIVLINFDRAALSELLYRNNYYGNTIQVNLYDEIPPFDMVLTFSNEHTGKMFDHNEPSTRMGEGLRGGGGVIRTGTTDLNEDGLLNSYDEIIRMEREIHASQSAVKPIGNGIGGLGQKKKYSALTLKNIRLIDEGMVTGVDEAFLETTFQYVAEDIEYLAPVTIG